MTAEAIRKLEELRTELDISLGLLPSGFPETRAAIRGRFDTIIDALKQSAGPGLPWVDVVERLPDEGPGRVLVVPRYYGSDDYRGELGGPDTAPISLVRDHPDLYAYWCERSAIPLPDSEGAEPALASTEGE